MICETGEPISVYYQKRITEIIHSLRNKFPHYEQYSDRTILNLSFRNGDELHSQWTSNDEAYILPFLVHTGSKPVATIVVQKNTEKYAKQLCYQVQQLCKVQHWHRVHTKIVLNRWNVYEVVLFQRSSSSNDITNRVGSISDSDIDGVANETVSFEIMGKFYGYNDDIYNEFTRNIEGEIFK